MVFYGYFTNSDVIQTQLEMEVQVSLGWPNGNGSVTGGDLQRFSGDIIYVENRSPVTRAQIRLRM